VAEAIRIMIADDDESVGAALVELIHSQPDLALAGFAFDTPSAIELAEREQPDVAIVDVRMPGGGGVTATIGIKQSSPTTQVIAFSAENDETIKAAMTAAGASSYLVKGTTLDMILETLRAAAHRSADQP
jgi:DNA-binding NarL/FixJ family response regulator